MTTKLAKTLILLAAVAVPLAAAGCAGSTMSPTEKLKRIAHRFNENVRWQRFEHAAKNVPLEQRELWVAAQEQAAGSLRIVDYEVRPVLLTEKISILEVDVTYLRIHDHTVKKQRRRQVWKHREGGWELASDKEFKRKKPAKPIDKFPDFEVEDDDEPPKSVGQR